MVQKKGMFAMDSVSSVASNVAIWAPKDSPSIIILNLGFKWNYLGEL